MKQLAVEESGRARTGNVRVKAEASGRDRNGRGAIRRAIDVV